MRKRLIITNVVMVFLSLICLLLISVAVITKENRKQLESELKTYLNLSSVYYDGTNNKETVNMFKKSSEKIRITIISPNGAVLADTFDNKYDSHLEREEIKNLGTFVERYSDTLSKSMLYIATKDDGNYIRVSISTADINPILDTYVNASIASLFVIVLVSTILMWPINKKELEPLVGVTNQLNRITNQPCSDSFTSIEEISNEIEHVGQIINEQILEINYAKNQIEYIINNLNQGLIVIDKNNEVSLINDYAKKIFNMKPEFINSNYIYIIRNQELQAAIEKAFIDNSDIDLTMDNKIYHITFSKMEDKLIVIMYDVTIEYVTNQMKREFFQNASHELKSPLTSILGYQQMIQDGILTEEGEIKGAINKTINEAQRMKQIIVEMLELSKLESKIEFDIEEVNIKEVVSEVLYLFEPKIEEKRITINNEISDLIVNADPNHIYMLLKNIIENAIKYNKEEGVITIKNTKSEIIISDTGIGISNENIPHIFERFYRVDKAKSKESGGTGLGLAIVKHICNIYNYEINVESTLNQKTEFRISLWKNS